ncbi:MAG: MucB/RseB C-terminal domain-containing protein [Gammaproteobacteria bacterium]|nr:MucB/RseB C-terminal domain-containing protein [Gammaproteobacteria bacterium]
MIRTRRLRWLVFLCLAPFAVPAEEAVDWLRKMDQALNTLNYQGVFVRLRDGQVDPMKVIHRVHDGRAVERLIALDDVGREIISSGDEVVCFFPDSESVVVEKRIGHQPLLGAVPALSEEVLRNYLLSVKTGKSVLNRVVIIIDVNPKDHFRYGYRLWLDEQTGLPLISQVRGGQGQIIEQMRFASIEFPDEIPETAVMSGVDATGYRWSYPEHKAKQTPANVEQAWRADNLPAGFVLAVYRLDSQSQATQPVVHMVFSDGLASVSVFVEKPGPDEKPRSGPSRMGAANAYTLLVKEHLVTAIGEVPPVTVRNIASSVVAGTP